MIKANQSSCADPDSFQRIDLRMNSEAGKTLSSLLPFTDNSSQLNQHFPLQVLIRTKVLAQPPLPPLNSRGYYMEF